DLEDVADLAPQHRPGGGAAEGPQLLLDPGGDLDPALLHVQLDLVGRLLGCRVAEGVVGLPAVVRRGRGIDLGAVARVVAGGSWGGRRLAGRGTAPDDHDVEHHAGVLVAGDGAPGLGGGVDGAPHDGGGAVGR